MTNRLIIILIMLQIASLSYVLFVNRNEMPDNKTQALITSDTGHLLVKIDELKAEIRDVKNSIRQKNDIELSQTEIRNNKVQIKSNENDLSPIDTTADTPLNQDIIDESNTLVATAVSRTRWQQSDTQALMRLAPGLPRSQKSKLLNQIADAVNNQQLRLEAALPPM